MSTGAKNVQEIALRKAQYEADERAILLRASKKLSGQEPTGKKLPKDKIETFLKSKGSDLQDLFREPSLMLLLSRCYFAKATQGEDKYLDFLSPLGVEMVNDFVGGEAMLVGLDAYT